MLLNNTLGPDVVLPWQPVRPTSKNEEKNSQSWRKYSLTRSWRTGEIDIYTYWWAKSITFGVGFSRLDGHLTLLGGAETQQETSCLFSQHLIRHFTLTKALCVLICTWGIKPIQPMQKLHPAKGFKKTFCTVRPKRMRKCRIYDSHPDHL